MARINFDVPSCCFPAFSEIWIRNTLDRTPAKRRVNRGVASQLRRCLKKAMLVLAPGLVLSALGPWRPRILSHLQTCGPGPAPRTVHGRPSLPPCLPQGKSIPGLSIPTSLCHPSFKIFHKHSEPLTCVTVLWPVFWRSLRETCRNTIQAAKNNVVSLKPFKVKLRA